MASSKLLGGIGQALSNKYYLLFWATNGISTIGRWIYRTAVMWLAWELTESTFWLGLIAFADVFPMVALSVFGGAISDRIGYAKVIKNMQFCYTLVGLGFAVLNYFEAVNIWFVLGLTVCHGIIEALSTPPRLAMVNALVDRKDLSAAVALNSATFNGCRVVGPAIAGSLLLLVTNNVIGYGLVFAIATVLLFQFYVAMFFLPAKGAGGEGKISLDLLRDMVDGVIYVKGHSGIWFLMVILTITGILVRPFMELAPAYADLIFGLKADGLAIILSTVGGGALLSSLWLARRAQITGLTKLTTGWFCVLGVGLVAFSLTKNIIVAVPILFVIGFALLVTSIATQSLIQNAAVPAMRARAVSFFIMLNWGMPAIGALIMGAIATLVGLQVTIAGGAVLSLAFWLWAHHAGKRHIEILEASGGIKE